ncbi:AIR synthase-related protein [Desulfatitalea alkaliphila]|uniref:Phosphoribosylformylglycinamidine synthase subunit PurL n=1 Tax=Desulfatitalea alkaliphila TaxID=2929485 RepID=A0AA41QZK3_9BACT|nr:AIR synthase-related protein [Desulfatitalea alkaliphila]MCJ8500027.1 AIR synthase-related protein [Desulfatitalea alkaliphila]
MASRIEITLKPELIDAEGELLRRKAGDYFGIQIDGVRTVHIVTVDADLAVDQIERARNEIFTNPVTQISSLAPLPVAADWIIWVGFRPGVRDNPGATAVEAMADLLGKRFAQGEAVYTSRRYCLQGKHLTAADVERIANQLLANDIIQQWRIYSAADWDPAQGVGLIVPKVRLDHTPTLTVLPIDSDATLQRLSKERNLALNPNDIPVIRAYFLDPRVQAERAQVGLSDPTDLELEYISQARSDHCNHNTFRGLFHYTDATSGQRETIDNLFKSCIQTPTRQLQQQKPWVVSVLWDNAGVGRFDDAHYYTITGETHNSPSNMEAYGGAITGIVGIYRDPLGTGLGSRLIMGSYGFCVGPRDYAGDLKPRLHPRRLLDGVIEGVRDGGNKSGIPTPFGQVLFDHGYMGKCLVYVTALGIMPAEVAGRPSEQKTILPGDAVIMCGGRVGKDGIHGVTASSETFSAHTPAGHVQIGDPYTQKKMHDFLLEARDRGLIRFITDNGGGGLSSSVGETARFSNGCEIQLEKVPLKYAGLDQWEIWVSESQERMTVAVAPAHVEAFLALSARHGVESTVIGEYTDSGKLHITYEGRPCAYVDLDLLTAGFPQWTFAAEWRDPQARGLIEPVLGVPGDQNRLLLDMLARPNICSKEWISRQYDHEVQGTSVIKPLVGVGRDVVSDAAVLRPVLGSRRGLAFSQALLPFYSRIDAYHMTACTIDEAVRRLIAVGGDPEHLGGVDNFCWPTIEYDPLTNPDGRFKAAQLVRSCQALRDMCLAYEIPLLSGKDSMYVDGHLPGRYGETHKVSALESLQFSATSVIPDIERCVTLDPKVPGDRVYLLGDTRDELGGSEYYDLLGYVGCQVPRVWPEPFMARYRALAEAVEQGWIASAHGIFRGGLGVHLAMKAMAGQMGLAVDLARVPVEGNPTRDDVLLYAESAGRFILTVDPRHAEAFETLCKDLPLACIGRTVAEPRLTVQGSTGQTIIDLSVAALKEAWRKPFGDLI